MQDVSKESAAFLFMFDIVLLCLFNRSCRASACTRTAVDALIRIDFEFAIAHADSAYRALSLTSSTTNTTIINLVCHNRISSLYQ